MPSNLRIFSLFSGVVSALWLSGCGSDEPKSASANTPANSGGQGASGSGGSAAQSGASSALAGNGGSGASVSANGGTASGGATATGGAATGGAATGGSAGGLGQAGGGGGGVAGQSGDAGGSAGAAGSAGSGGSLGEAVLAQDDFRSGLAQWTTELENGGTVKAENGVLDVDVPFGVTVWFKQPFTDPLAIEFKATSVSAGGPNDHVTDLNMFWNARDSRSPNDLFATHRTGLFADYDRLLTYYVGFGANLNTTTRMRRYVGEDDNRPLVFDLTSPLLVANQRYQVRLVADGAKVQYWSDGKLLFDYEDAAPYTSGWFAFRTTGSHFQFSEFRVMRLK